MAPRGPVRAFAPSDIEALMAGARVVPGFTHKAVRDMRRRLGLSAREAAPTDNALAMMRLMASWDWCPHTWAEQSRVSLPSTDAIGVQTFAATQSRMCRRCGCAEVRMWTVDGYVTDWQRPQLPIRRKVQPCSIQGS